MTVPAEPYKDPDFLRFAYHVRGQTTCDLARVFGVSHGTIWYYMDKFGIELREPQRGLFGIQSPHGHRASR